MQFPVSLLVVPGKADKARKGDCSIDEYWAIKCKSFLFGQPITSFRVSIMSTVTVYGSKTKK